MSKEPMDIRGRVVAITGGARGIGRATAQAFVRAGARVAIGDLDQALATQTAQELAGGTVGLPLDVTDRASFEAFVSEAEAQLGPLDVLVNNAGIMPVGRFLDETDDSARRQLEINCHGVVYGMKIALPRFVDRGRGHLVNIASIVGKVPAPAVATYSGTKHFVVGMTEAVREELRGTGVEFSCVMPGPVNTELTAGVPNPRLVKFVEPEDVAAAIVDAVRTPRFSVYVPRTLAPLVAVGTVLPQRGRDAFGHLMKADVALTTDPASRRAYEQRAAASAPAAEEAAR
jgi:NAD(P)-dependent dehydrogenase (short-subunit alcohol dehydrogenase family)